MARPKKQNKENPPKIEEKPNKVAPSLADEYRIAWQLEYDRLSEAQKLIINEAQIHSVHGAYTRHYFVDAFVARVIDLVEAPEEKD